MIKFHANPGERHWEAVKCILTYLRRTKDLFLVYGGEELKLQGYIDSSFQSNPYNSRSTSGYMFTLNGGEMSWKSSKQPTIAYSMTEAEYIATSDATKEAVWLKKFIIDLGVVSTILDPIPMLCDNNGAIAQAKEPRSHQNSKHILRHFHLIREIVARGDVVLERVPLTDNVADPLTKPLAQEVLERHYTTLGFMHRGNWF